MKRYLNILFITLAAITILAVGDAYAQTIPNPDWKLDSVVNGSVHKYTVTGDQNYDSPSSFVWTVEGGRLFLDENLTTMIGDGISGTVVGDVNNITTLWVVWDSFDQPLDTGYVYVYEISDDGCQRAITDDDKYQGMRIKVSAPPKVRFLTDEINVCSNDEGILVDIEIDGMPPFSLTYSIDGDEYTRYIETSDLVDSDSDGRTNNVTITINDFVGTTVDMVYDLELVEASSGGVFGEMNPDSSYLTVYAYVQPDAPVLNHDWLEVTTGQTHTYSLQEAGITPDVWYWELYDASDNMVFDNSTTDSDVSIPMGFAAGEYDLMVYFLSTNGCLSLSDTMTIEVFDNPVLAFADTSLDAVGCSEATINPNEFFEFTLNYQGARSYNFNYAVYDYNNVMLFDSLMEYQTDRALLITIPNTFINDELPEINRAWKVKLLYGENEEKVDIEIPDSDTEGGSDERLIIIHPKPVINDNIDFAN